MYTLLICIALSLFVYWLGLVIYLLIKSNWWLQLDDKYRRLIIGHAIAVSVGLYITLVVWGTQE